MLQPGRPLEIYDLTSLHEPKALRQCLLGVGWPPESPLLGLASTKKGKLLVARTLDLPDWQSLCNPIKADDFCLMRVLGSDVPDGVLSCITAGEITGVPSYYNGSRKRTLARLTHTTSRSRLSSRRTR